MVSHTEKVITEAPLTSGMDAKREEQPNDTDLPLQEDALPSTYSNGRDRPVYTILNCRKKGVRVRWRRITSWSYSVDTKSPDISSLLLVRPHTLLIVPQYFPHILGHGRSHLSDLSAPELGLVRGRIEQGVSL